VRKKRAPLTPDLTPLIDVIFLLLIFFMVTSVFKKDELALMLALPDSSSGVETKIEKKDITIELTKDKLAYEAKEVNFEYLQRELSNIKDKNKPINVRIDESVEYKRVVRVLDILQKHNLTNLSLITNK
jgi:biopolymer transport protein ExbD